jgi:hypothetical protein
VFNELPLELTFFFRLLLAFFIKFHFINNQSSCSPEKCEKPARSFPLLLDRARIIKLTQFGVHNEDTRRRSHNTPRPRERKSATRPKTKDPIDFYANASGALPLWLAACTKAADESSRWVLANEKLLIKVTTQLKLNALKIMRAGDDSNLIPSGSEESERTRKKSFVERQGVLLAFVWKFLHQAESESAR